MHSDIWYTTAPTHDDLPIRAYVVEGQLKPVVYRNELPNWPVIAWQPYGHGGGMVYEEFQKLANKEETTEWTASDWFKAGYAYSKTIE
jgi:hypothetical protein